MSQNGPKTTSLMTSLTKNPQPPPKKNFSECRLEGWLIRLRVSTALRRNRLRSYGFGKATDNCWFKDDFKVQIYRTLALKVLIYAIFIIAIVMFHFKGSFGSEFGCKF